MFKKISIIYNATIEPAKALAEKVCIELQKFSINAQIQKFDPETTCKTEEFDKDINLAIAIGGDGTFISIARFYAQYDVPILGINLGRLGFLAQIQPQKIANAIEQLVEGNYRIEERIMLNCFDKNQNFNFNALNDVVIKGGSLARTEHVYLSIGDELVSDYLADGLIISTPTGSTAYTLSAGGPIITPTVDVLTIVPICPHCLGARPLVIPADEKISIKVDAKMYVTGDGQKNYKLKSNNSILIMKQPNTAKLVFINNIQSSFYGILKEKLNWGVAPRNNA